MNPQVEPEFLEAEVLDRSFPRSGACWVEAGRAGPLARCWSERRAGRSEGFVLVQRTRMKPCLSSQVPVDGWKLFSAPRAHAASGHWQGKCQQQPKPTRLRQRGTVRDKATAPLVWGNRFHSHEGRLEGATEVFCLPPAPLLLAAPHLENSCALHGAAHATPRDAHPT